MSAPQKLFAEDRDTVEVAYAGDVIGLNNPDAFAIGDTLYAAGTPKVRRHCMMPSACAPRRALARPSPRSCPSAL